MPVPSHPRPDSMAEVGTGRCGIGEIDVWRSTEFEDLTRVVPQEFRPRLIGKRQVVQLSKNALEGKPARVIAGVDDLSATTRAVGVLDDVAGVMLRGKGTRRVVKV